MKILPRPDVISNSAFSVISSIFLITRKQHPVEQSALSTSATLGLNKIKGNKPCQRFWFWSLCILALLTTFLYQLCQGDELFVQHIPDASHYYLVHSNPQIKELMEPVKKYYFIDLVIQFDRGRSRTRVDYRDLCLCFTHALIDEEDKQINILDSDYQSDWNSEDQRFYCYTWKVLTGASILTKRVETNTWSLRLISRAGQIPPQLHYKATGTWNNKKYQKLTCLVYPVQGLTPTKSIGQKPKVVLPNARQDERYLSIFQTIFCSQNPDNSATSTSLFHPSYGAAADGQIPSSPALYIEKIKNGTLVDCVTIPDMLFRETRNLTSIKQWVEFFEKIHDHEVLKNCTANPLATVEGDEKQQAKESNGEEAGTPSSEAGFDHASPLITQGASNINLETLQKSVGDIVAIIATTIPEQQQSITQEAQEEPEQEQGTLASAGTGGLAVQQDYGSCEHYERHCHVRFPCCEVFYPCHRCHNSANASNEEKTGTCENEDAKVWEATHFQCRYCGHEQEIDETAEKCENCHSSMSDYFCPICKHYTSMDKDPYHCEKCGICRTYKDKSFHCDMCNICLDKSLEGKHKCRPDSGHDLCFICLKDVFSGCQILPCSHKVHRKCLMQMYQNGVKSCPLCHEPFTTP